MKNTKRTRVAEGIYQDASGYQAVVKLGRLKPRTQRFSINTAITFMQSWRVQQRAEMDADRQTAPAGPEPERGTFEADLPRHLKQIKGRVSFKADRSHLRAWLPALGRLNRTKIKAANIRETIGEWLEAGKSARTIRHRVRVLRELYQTLDGEHARPPLQGVKLPTIPEANPTPVSLTLIRRVAASLKAGKRTAKGYGGDSLKCYARFLVRALTGQRACQIMRAVRTDVDFKRKVWYVRSAKGGNSVAFPLDNPEVVAAWRLFIAADAFGPFDTRSFSKTIRRHGWPSDVRPHNLRHTFAIDHLKSGTDIGDLQGLLGHRQLETTRRFYAPQQLARLRKAIGTRRLKIA